MADAGRQWWRDDDQTLEGRWTALARQFLSPLVIYAIVAAPYSLFSLLTTGRPLPNTFYAKVGSEHFFSLRTLRETLAWHWQDNPVSLVLILPGILPVWRRSRLAVLWLLGLPLFTAVIIDFTWHHGRYTIPLIPLQIVTAAVGIHWLAVKLAAGADTAAKSWRHQMAWLLPPALILLFLLGGTWRLPYWAVMLGHNAREIQDIDVALGNWLAENTAPDALIAVDDIGAIAFLSRRQIVDMNGLVSPEVWPALQAAEGLPRNQALTRILSQSQPDLVAAFPLWRWDMVTNQAVAKPLHHVQTDTHTITFQQDAYVYEMIWPYVQEAGPQTEVMVTFGEGIQLLGYDALTNNPLQLTLYWKSLAAIPESYDIFIHLLDESGNIIAQVDQKPAGGLAATDVWQPGDIIRDPLTISMPENLPAGSYELHLGVYLRESGERLAVQGAPEADQTVFPFRLSLP